MSSSVQQSEVSRFASWQKRKKVARTIRITVTYFLLTIVGLVLISPFLWMLMTAVKTQEQTYNQAMGILPRPITFEHFFNIFRVTPMAIFMRNSLYVTVTAVVGAVISSTLVAYSFARLRWFGRNFMFGVLLATMMIPSQATMIPIFITFHKLGWVNTFKPLIVPSYLASGLQGAFFVFLLRQFILTIPREIDESARIDGCGYFQIYLRMIVPLLKPALGSVFMFAFIWHWNEFMSALIYLSDKEKFTMPMGLQYFRFEEYTDWNLLMAAAVLGMLPCIIIFFIGQKYFLRSITLSGAKG